jgi:hypothetical protein
VATVMEAEGKALVARVKEVAGTAMEQRVVRVMRVEAAAKAGRIRAAPPS